jgi:hypothetical protein
MPPMPSGSPGPVVPDGLAVAQIVRNAASRCDWPGRNLQG